MNLRRLLADLEQERGVRGVACEISRFRVQREAPRGNSQDRQTVRRDLVAPREQALAVARRERKGDGFHAPFGVECVNGKLELDERGVAG